MKVSPDKGLYFHSPCRCLGIRDREQKTENRVQIMDELLPVLRVKALPHILSSVICPLFSESHMYLPININIKNKNCLVVGAGNVALKKIQTLLSFGARVTVVAPEQADAVKKLANRKKIKLKNRKFKSCDLKNVHLIIAATDDRALNKKIFSLAQKTNTPINVVDNPGLCTFIMPSIIKRGNLIISVSTSGKVPALSVNLRKEIEKLISPEFKNIISKLEKIRKKAKQSPDSAGAAFWQDFFNFSVIKDSKNNFRELKEKIKKCQ